MNTVPRYVNRLPLAGGRGTFSGNRWLPFELKPPLVVQAKCKSVGGEIHEIVGAGGIAYVLYGKTHGVAAIDLSTGETLWNLGKDGPNHGQYRGGLYLIPNGLLLVGNGGEDDFESSIKLTALNIKNGARCGWEAPYNVIFGVWDNGLWGIGVSDEEKQRWVLSRIDLTSFTREDVVAPLPPSGTALLHDSDWIVGKWIKDDSRFGRVAYVRVDPEDMKILEEIPEDFNYPTWTRGRKVICVVSEKGEVITIQTGLGEEKIQLNEYGLKGVCGSGINWRCGERELPGIPGIANVGLGMKSVMIDEDRDSVIFLMQSADDVRYWMYQLGSRKSSPGSVTNGTVLCCRSVKTGEFKWAREFVQSYNIDAWGAGGTIWVVAAKAARDRFFYKDELDGLREELRAACKPSCYGDDLYGIQENEPGRLLALDAETGETIWSRAINGRRMILNEDGIAVSTGSGVVSLRPK